MRALDISHHNARKNPDGTYTVTADIAAAYAAGAVGFITRSCYGTRLDTTAAEHNRRVDAAGAPRAFYWYDLSRQDPVRMAEVAFTAAGSPRGMRGWCDLEENRRADGADPVYPAYSPAYFQHVDTALMTCDLLTGTRTGVYSTASWLNSHFTLSQQEQWAEMGRPCWVAHWAPAGPGIPAIPLGWKGRPDPYVLWQDMAATWPGFASQVDQSQVPAWVADLSEIFGALPTTPPPSANPLDRIDQAVMDIRSVL